MVRQRIILESLRAPFAVSAKLWATPWMRFRSARHFASPRPEITLQRVHRAGPLILVVVPLDVAAVQDVAISLRKFDHDDGNDKGSNGEKNHRYDQGRRVGPHQWPPPAPEWLISSPLAGSQSLLLLTAAPPSAARGFHERLSGSVRDLSLPSRIRPAGSHSEIQAQRASGVFVPPRS
jgi:hypothetical protein